MNFPSFLILFTPVPYIVFLAFLYFLFYFRDPLRLARPQKEKGHEIWRQVLLTLRLVSEAQSSSQKKIRKISKDYVMLLAFALVQPIGGWILSSFLSGGFSLLLQFSSALVVLFFVIIPSLGSTAPVWRKYVSNLGSPKRRLGSRVSHLLELREEPSSKNNNIGERLPQPQTILQPSKTNERLSGSVQNALPPASLDEKSEANDGALIAFQESEDEIKSQHGVA